MAEVRRTAQAEADLEEILHSLDRSNSAAAGRLAGAFAEKGQTLAQFPEIGRLRPEMPRTFAAPSSSLM